MKKKIIIVSGTRADYGLLKKLIISLQSDSEFEAYLAATGTHLSEKHGNTINLIKEDEIENIIEVDIQISGDRPSDISRSLTLGINKFSELFQQIQPDFIVVLGDRYELWSACIPATIFNIPIVHIHGGESTQGVIDEAIRHSITKMAQLHLCSHESYKRRIEQMGEQPDSVHVVGATGLDRIREMVFLSREELSKLLGINFGDKNILCTFHPVTLSANESSVEVEALTKAIELFLIEEEINIKFFITFPNSDTYSSVIQNKWDQLIKKYPNNVKGFVNLGDLRYLSLMKEVELVLGNSSSGILEAPFLKKAVVDIGMRQKGRLGSGHIIHSDGNLIDIKAAIKKGLSEDFQASLKDIPSIYGEGKSTPLMYEIIKKINFKNNVLKKFYDTPESGNERLEENTNQ